MKLPKSRKKRIAFAVKHKRELIAQKKSIIKRADPLGFSTILVLNKKDKAKKNSKTNKNVNTNKNELEAIVVISSSNIFDSHTDVHMPKMWDKSLKERGERLMHVQEHKSDEFDKIISDGKDLKAYTKVYTWRELGLKSNGSTEVLEFNSNVKKSRNKFMFGEYKKGHVKNHSVGMVYVKMTLAVDDKDYPEEYKAWKDNIDDVVNKKEAKAYGLMWLINEAKAIEGSAVPEGSNFMTPTRSVKSKKSKKAKKNKNSSKEFVKYLKAGKPLSY